MSKNAMAILLFLLLAALSLTAVTSCGIVSVTYYETDHQASDIDTDPCNSPATSDVITKPTAATTEEEPAVTLTDSEPVIDSPETDVRITLVSLTSPVAAGDTAEISIKGRPYTEYKIAVYYSSGASRAAGLEPKSADSGGNVSWRWNVSSRTSAGTFNIVITGGCERFETDFTVEN